ncbi:MAG: hypothetical protein AAGJ37_07375 [Pseudomonadota bacterium]
MHRFITLNPRKHSQLGRIGLGWLIFIAVIGLVIITLVLPDGKSEQRATLPSAPFDERLLMCNDVSDAELTDAFSQCLDAAKDGQYQAQRKIAWAYSQSGDYQSLEEAYKWVTRISNYDRSAELIRYILLRLFGNNPADVAYGEEGIQRLANLNYAPAAAYLGILYKLGENVLDETSNSMWLLQRAHEKDPEVFNAYQLAIIYANGFGVEQDYSKARDILLRYAEYEFPMTTNNVAWFLATLEDNPLSPPDTAVSLAESVISVEPHGENHVYVDTLAATYAARGNYVRATEQQMKALKKLQRLAEIETNNDYSTLISEYNDRLALYEDNKKAVTETLKREYDSFFKGVKVFVERRLISGLNVYIEKPNTESLQH